MHTLYLGSSWAEQSYESVNGRNDPVKTNLAKELELVNYTSLAAQRGNSSLTQVEFAQEFMHQHPELAPFRIVFVTANTLDDGHDIFNISRVDFARKFLTTEDPIGLTQYLEEVFYQKLDALGVPVALIGASVDVTCKSHNNITVIHPSWQNFLSQKCNCNVPSFYGWNAGIADRWLRGIVIPEVGPPERFELGSTPSTAMFIEIQRLKSYWKIMREHKLLVGGHPNILGNQLFAQEIKQSVNNWIDKHQ
jgi:hypothetical protein